MPPLIGWVWPVGDDDDDGNFSLKRMEIRGAYDNQNEKKVIVVI